jgi:hypothetical protein
MSDDEDQQGQASNNKLWRASAESRAETERQDIDDANAHDQAVIDAKDRADDVAQEEPSGRVSNRDLWRLSAVMNDRCSAIDHGLQSMLDHVDSGFDDLRANMRDLRGVVNEQLHAQDQRIAEGHAEVDKLREVIEPMRRGWDIRVALLKGSWKLTGAMIGAAAVISGLIVRFGPPWFWHFGI